ncbi:hypothetical protein BY458DRAFT_221456 [Sporodiniella umbellata]|nr:hypothetical protein BY458DRAFT_221456 [Sporodiniella umbellata]
MPLRVKEKREDVYRKIGLYKDINPSERIEGRCFNAESQDGISLVRSMDKNLSREPRITGCLLTTDNFKEHREMVETMVKMCRLFAGTYSRPEKNVYPCEVYSCRVQCSSSCSLDKHLRRIHSQFFQQDEIPTKNKYKCILAGCNRPFSTLNNLRFHIKKFHVLSVQNHLVNKF